MHWHAAGLGAYANMRFPQWAFSHRPCARSGRTRSKSSWLRLTGPIGRGSQNWCSSRQPLLGKFLWGGIYFLREGAPSGTRAQTCGISTYGPWTGRGGSKWATSSGSKHYHFCQGPVYETGLQAEVEPVRRLVFSPPGGPPVDAQSQSCFLSCRMGWSEGCLPPPSKCMLPAIAAHHDAVDGKSLGKHDLVIRFLRGARRLNPPRPHLVPSWDLPSVLSALRGAPFEPLQSVELKFLSLKTVLLSALATVKRVGDLQAFSVDDSCLEFGPADSHVVLRPPAWICAQSSHHALQGPGGELASAAPGRRQTQPLLCSVPFMPCASMWTARRASGPQISSLSASEDSRREELSPNKDSPTG